MSEVKILHTSDLFWTFLPFLFVWFLWARLSTLKVRRPPVTRSVTIVVLGDIGRSPRMMYHAESFAKAGFNTTIVGYKETALPPFLRSLGGIQFRYLVAPPSLPRAFFVILAPMKVILQLASLVHILLLVGRPSQYILVQNPPSIPTLAVVQLVSRLRGSKLIIDWHNLGYSILALKLGNDHFLVRLAKWFEKTFGQVAYAHLFVTSAMKDHLMQTWHLKGKKVVLHDRPPSRFHSTSETEVHELFLRLPPFHPPLDDFVPPVHHPTKTLRTELTTQISNTGEMFPSSLSPIASLRADRPALVITSTSWTPDEDFSVLIAALRIYELKARKSADRALPKLLMVVTGKGPLKAKYISEISRIEVEEQWKWVRCRALWVEAADYPLILGSADFGVSLHSSSSALDLPMKVVDMFGCGLPVCALDFACLDELVKDGVNGLVFSSAEQLAEQFELLLSGFPTTATILKKLRNYFTQLGSRSSQRNGESDWSTWDENWNRVVRPLVDSDVHEDF